MLVHFTLQRACQAYDSNISTYYSITYIISILMLIWMKWGIFPNNRKTEWEIFPNQSNYSAPDFRFNR